MKRRRMRRYRSMKQNSGVKFLGFIGIILGAVICGYLTARFVVAPLLGYETEVLKLDFPSKLTSLVEDSSKDSEEGESREENDADKDVEEDTNTQSAAPQVQTDSYALQFGVFSTKSSASTLVNTLKKDGIAAEVKEVDGQYKVLSETFEKKEDALKALETLREKKNIDVFITVLKE